MNDDAIDAASDLAEILERLGVPYMIGGSLASIMWGEPRFTQDVDFVTALEGSHVAPFTRALGERWYVDESSVREAVARRASFNVIRLHGMVKVDVFVPPRRAFTGASGVESGARSSTRRAIAGSRSPHLRTSCCRSWTGIDKGTRSPSSSGAT